MRVEGWSASQEQVDIDVDTDDRCVAFARFRKMYPNSRVAFIGNTECYGECPTCGGPVMADHDYEYLESADATYHDSCL